MVIAAAGGYHPPVNGVPERIEQSIRLRSLLRRGDAVLVAVSGGVDSMVLLSALHKLSPRHGWRLTVAHFNHRLRGRSSDADERLVRRTAETLKLPLVVEAGNVREFAKAHKLSLEMAARKLRHDFLARTAANLHIRRIALAHHADDQVELFFLRLLRGGGGDGLAGMKWRNASPSDPGITLIRPLLDCLKAELSACAEAKGVRFREDASNARLEIMRNRLRHELLPLLRAGYQPALDRIVARLMDLVGADAEFVSKAAAEWLSDMRRGRRTRPFGTLPIALQRRCLQTQLLGFGIAADFEMVERLRTAENRPISVGRVAMAADSVKGKTLAMDGSEELLAERSAAGLVRLRPAQRIEFNDGCIEVELKGRAGKAALDGGRIGWRIQGAIEAIKPRRIADREFFDADKVGSQVVLRHWRPGDRFQPIGLASPVKLQDLFTNGKVPRARRRELLVGATASGEVFWVEGLRISERFKLTSGTNRCLQWRWWRA